MKKEATNFKTFLTEEESGSATLWNLMWFTQFVVLLGLGLDTTAAMHSKANLQNVADAAAHAGAEAIFPNVGVAVTSAVEFGKSNSVYADGTIGAPDIEVGYWNEDTRTFEMQNVPFFNAVRSAAVRDSTRSNEVVTEFLARIGFRGWDIRTGAVARLSAGEFLDGDCAGNGLIAGGELNMTANNTYVGSTCLHGETSFRITQNNIITCGTMFSTPSANNWATGGNVPSGNPGECSDDYANLTNDQMIDQATLFNPNFPILASLEYQSHLCYMKSIFGPFDDPECPSTTFGTENDPFNAIPPYIQAVQGPIDVGEFNRMVDNYARDYFSNNNGSGGNGGGNAQLVPGTLYHVNCVVKAGNGGQKLVLTGVIQNIGIYTNCEIDVQRHRDVSDVRPTKHISGGKKVTSEICDPDTEDCSMIDWEAEIQGAQYGCLGDGDAQHPLDPDTPLDISDDVDGEDYFEGYTTLLDTAAGEEYRAGVLDPTQVINDTIAEICAVEPGSTGLWDNVFIVTTAFYDDPDTVVVEADPKQRSISFPQNMQLGRIDGCQEGGGVRIYSGGSIHTPSGTTIHGSHFTVVGDLKLAAKLNGTWGVTGEATGDIEFSAQGIIGGCGYAATNQANDFVRTVRPLALVQ